MKKLLTVLLATCLGINYLSGQNTFPATGNAGAKTTTPVSELQVNGVLAIGGGATINAKNLIQIKPDNTTFFHRLIFGADATPGAKFGISKNVAGVVTDYFVVQDNGNVGVGTATPTTKLDVAGAINTNSTINATGAITGGSTIAATGAITGGTLTSTNLLTAGSLKLPLTLPLITGTSSPIGIDATTGLIGKITIAGGTAGTSSNGLTTTGANTVLGGTLTQATTIAAGTNNLLITGNAGTNSLTVLGTGNIGIGTATPTTKLDVAGAINTNSTINATGAITGGSTIATTGAITGGTVTSTNLLTAGSLKLPLTLPLINGTSSPIGIDATTGLIGKINIAGDTASSLIDSTNNNSYWNRSGNLGIGTKVPSTKLDVKGDVTMGANSFLRIYDTGGNNGRLAFNNLGSIDFTTAFMFRNVTGTSEYMRINNVGNVGIGTADPKRLLHISAPTNPEFWIETKDITGVGAIWRTINRAGSLRFEAMNSTAGGEIYPLTLSSNGNVGIGTVVPTVKLDVLGDLRLSGTNSNLYIGSNPILTGSSHMIGRAQASNFHITGSTAGDLTIAAQGGNNIHFGTTSVINGVTNSNLNVMASGNVGIGTTTPTKKLHIKGDVLIEGGGNTLTLAPANFTTYTAEGLFDVKVKPSLISDNPGGNRNIILGYRDFGSGEYYPRIGFRSNTVSNWSLGASNAAGDFSIGLNNVSSSDYLTILKNGQVGIGTLIVPGTHKLAVGGSIIAEEVLIKLKTAWPDFVFAKNYNLKPLAEVEQFVKANNHLPEIPSAKEVEAKGGQELGEMNRLLLKKVEELTLYLIDQNKKLENQQKEIDALKVKVNN
jgi:hypothetical protein